MGQRNIGGGGESFFGAWCNLAGITANVSASDMNGWDVLIEMDSPETALNPLRVHEGMVEAKIQIKSTDGSKKHVDVELSNLRKMSTTLLPAFYVLIEFDKKYAPVRAYVRHVDKAMITDVLKRIAELTKGNPKVKLNERKMRVKFTEEILPLDPSTLKSLLKKHLGASQAEYVEIKRAALESAGFENGGYRIQFSIPDVQQLEKLIDASLGKQVGVEVSELHGSVVRFGLTTHLPALSSSSAVLSIMDILPDDIGKLTFRKKVTGQSYSFQANFYRGVINSLLPLERQKIRIDANYFEMLLRNDKKSMTLTMSISPNQPYDIEGLLKSFSAFQMLREPQGIKLELDFFGVKASFDLRTSEALDDCAYQISKLRKIVDIKRYFDWSEPLMLTLAEIEPELERLDRAHALFVNAIGPITLSFNESDGPPIGVEVNCFYVASLKLGRYLFVDLFVVAGVVETQSSQRQKIVGLNRVSIYKTVLESETNIAETLKEEIEAAMNNHEPKLTVLDFTPLFFTQILGVPHEHPA